MNKSLALHQCILYYKERRQLKTFLTQFGPVLPLTPDPPVRLCDDRKGGMTIKIAIWEAFMPKTYFFVTDPTSTHPSYPLGPLFLPNSHSCCCLPPSRKRGQQGSNSVCTRSLFGIRLHVRTGHLVRWARVAASDPGYGVRDKHQEGRSWTPGPAACTSLEIKKV
jgi:hypothetical protein